MPTDEELNEPTMSEVIIPDHVQSPETVLMPDTVTSPLGPAILAIEAACQMQPMQTPRGMVPGLLFTFTTSQRSVNAVLMLDGDNLRAFLRHCKDQASYAIAECERVNGPKLQVVRNIGDLKFP